MAQLTSRRPLITLTTDFGVQSQSVGIMEITARMLAPQADIVHLMHGLPAFDIHAAARTMESLFYAPPGFHVCVCDPGVGTSRKAIVCKSGRGDYLIGPDNGVLIPAARLLGGIGQVHEIVNPRYMRTPVSPIFHGRDVFVPAAAHLANGVQLEELGPSFPPEELNPAPYEEATWEGNVLHVMIIQINKFGALHLNITHATYEERDLHSGSLVNVVLPNGQVVSLTVASTFGDVRPKEHVILRDDYGRIEIATNLGSFATDFGLSIGETLILELVRPVT